MQTNRQRYAFYFIAILAVILVSSVSSVLGELLRINCDDYSEIALPVGLFLISCIYPLKIFSEDGTLIGMHRQALKASGFFIFTSIAIYLDELLANDLNMWTEILVPLSVLLLAILVYNIMLRFLSKDAQSSNTETPVNDFPTQ